jgi:hypothetical protein
MAGYIEIEVEGSEWKIRSRDGKEEMGPGWANGNPRPWKEAAVRKSIYTGPQGKKKLVF